MLIAGVSLAGKAAYYGDRTVVGDNAEAEQRLAANLSEQGWDLFESYELLAEGPALMKFRHRDCAGALTVVLAGWKAELADLVVLEADSDQQLQYVYKGQALAQPPSFAYIEAKIADLLSSVGLLSGPGPQLMLVVGPTDCRRAESLRWPSVI